MSSKAWKGSLPLSLRTRPETVRAKSTAATGASRRRRGIVQALHQAASRRAGAGHVGAQLLGRDRRRVQLGHDAAPEHDQQPVGQPDQLLEVGRHQQGGQPRGPGVAEVVPDRGLGAHVDAPGRVVGEQDLRPRPSAHGPRSASAGCRRTGRNRRRRRRGPARRRCPGSPRCGAWPRAGRSTAPWRRAAGSGGRASRSPRGASSSASPAGGGPRGCSRCRLHGGPGCRPRPGPRRRGGWRPW